MKLKNWMRRDFKTASKRDTILDVAKVMKDNFTDNLIVVDNGKPIGIITERDIVYKVVALGKGIEETKVSDIMTQSLIMAHVDDTISEVSTRMGLAKIKQLPIVDETGSLVGMISSTDLVKIISHLQKDLHSMVNQVDTT